MKALLQPKEQDNPHPPTKADLERKFRMMRRRGKPVIEEV